MSIGLHFRHSLYSKPNVSHVDALSQDGLIWPIEVPKPNLEARC
jgi:hypothetical protein